MCVCFFFFFSIFRLQLLKRLRMFLLELPQIFLDDGMAFLELGMLGLQSVKHVQDLGELGLRSIPSHGSLKGLTLDF